MSKVILITGNRKGIGRKLTEMFLDDGFKVAGCSRTETDLVNGSYLHVTGDVSNEKDVKRIVKSVVNKFGKIDILVNNAGIASLNHSILTPKSTVEKLMGTNFLGTFLLSRECSKIMMKFKYGRIINFTTVAVPLNLEGEMVYASSKVAVEKMTKIMSKELGEYGITLNSIGPTPVDTDLIRTVPKDKIKEIISNQSIKRLGLPSDIKNVIDFYISDSSSFITGQTIYLGGL